MNDTPKSKAELAIEEIMRQLDPASERYRILETAKRFKSTWVELGEQLVQINTSGKFRDWGYEQFEDYCSKEVRIKKPTAQKLTLAYHFMEKEEPELLARRTELKPLPDFRSVDLLRQARDEKGFSEEEYAELRKAVVEEDRCHPTVLKKFKEVSAVRCPEPSDPTKALRSALGAARRLETLIEEVPDVPDELFSSLARLVAYLEKQAAQSGPILE